MATESSDIVLVDVVEEEVSNEFSKHYIIRAESDEHHQDDTSRLLSQRHSTFRYFTFQHLR